MDMYTTQTHTQTQYAFEWCTHNSLSQRSSVKESFYGSSKLLEVGDHELKNPMRIFQPKI